MNLPKMSQNFLMIYEEIIGKMSQIFDFQEQYFIKLNLKYSYI